MADGSAIEEFGAGSFAAAQEFGKSNQNASAPEQRNQQLTPQEVHFAVAFTRVISVLMKSNPYRTMPLNQVEGLVVPALLSGQFAIMDAEVNAQPTPVAVAFWAHVSPEVDQRLSDTSIPVPKLGPNDWRSGEVPWLLDVVGHPQAAQQLMGRLKDGIFAGLDVKMRRSTVNGGASISCLHDLNAGRHTNSQYASIVEN